MDNRVRGAVLTDVEMRIARLRALTHPVEFSVCFLEIVEMRIARLRASGYKNQYGVVKSKKVYSITGKCVEEVDETGIFEHRVLRRGIFEEKTANRLPFLFLVDM